MKTIGLKLNRMWKISTGFLLLTGALSSAQAGLTQLSVGYYTDYSFGMTVQGTSQTSISSAFKATKVAGDPLPISHPNPFVTFCLDIDSTLANGWWKSGSFSDVSLTSDTGKLRQPDSLYYAAQLYQTYSGGIMSVTGTWVDKAKGSALQLAIWEVLYETTSGPFALGSGAGFAVTSGNSSVRTQAQTMLDSLAVNGQRIAPNLNLDTMFWNAVKADGTTRSSQDLIGPFTPVPEPTTYIAAALLCLPIAINGMRKLRQRRS